jgi:hypothetical protein
MAAKNDAMTPGDRATGTKRQKYDRPVVVVYGDIRAITRNVGGTGKQDGGGTGKTKTGTP